MELRQYTLHPGKRDTLIQLFDSKLIEPQERLGMTVIGQFRVVDDANRFVWLRGFSDMPSRATQLAAFYGGPVWRQYRDAANATIVDSDNVLLLRPSRADAGFSLNGGVRSPNGRKQRLGRLYVANVYRFREPIEPEFIPYFELVIAPALTNAGACLRACYVTERVANNFPALPVREHENALVWFATFPTTAAYAAFEHKLYDAPEWREVEAELERRLSGPPEVLRLAATSRSLVF